MPQSEFSNRLTRRDRKRIEQTWTQSLPVSRTLGELRAERKKEIDMALVRPGDPDRIRARHRAEEQPRSTAPFGIQHPRRTR